MALSAWPAGLSAAAFEALHDDLPAWRAGIEQLAQGLGEGPVLQMASGTVLVALLGRTRVLKLYPRLGPLAFLAAGHAGRCRAFFDGYGVLPDAAERLALMRLLLLHRYSHLPAQIAHPGWQAARSFEDLTALIWP